MQSCSGSELYCDEPVFASPHPCYPCHPWFKPLLVFRQILGIANELDELRSQAVHIPSFGISGHFQHTIVSDRSLVLGISQQHAESSYTGGESEICAGNVEGSIDLPGERFLYQLAGIPIGSLIAQLHR